MGLSNIEYPFLYCLSHTSMPFLGFSGVERSENRRLRKFPYRDVQIIKGGKLGKHFHVLQTCRQQAFPETGIRTTVLTHKTTGDFCLGLQLRS